MIVSGAGHAADSKAISDPLSHLEIDPASWPNDLRALYTGLPTAVRLELLLLIRGATGDLPEWPNEEEGTGWLDVPGEPNGGRMCLDRALW